MRVKALIYLIETGDIVREYTGIEEWCELQCFDGEAFKISDKDFRTHRIDITQPDHPVVPK